MDYLEVCCLVPRCLKIFLLSVTDFYSDSIVLGKCILNNSTAFKFVKVCCMAQGLPGCVFLVHLERMYILLSLNRVFKILIQSFWLMVFRSSLISLPIFCVFVLSVFEREMLKDPTIIVILSISLSVLSVFASHILQIYCLVRRHLGLLCVLGGLTLLSLYNVLHSFWSFSLLWSLFFLMLM